MNSKTADIYGSLFKGESFRRRTDGGQNASQYNKENALC